MKERTNMSKIINYRLKNIEMTLITCKLNREWKFAFGSNVQLNTADERSFQSRGKTDTEGWVEWNLYEYMHIPQTIMW